MLRKFSLCLLCAVGVALSIAGQYTVGHPGEASEAVEGRVGDIGRRTTGLMANRVPGGIVMGYGAILLGAALAALAFGPLSLEAGRQSEPAPVPLEAGRDRFGTRLTALACALALLGAAGSRLAALEAWAVATWLWALAAACVAMIRCDRIRHCSLGNPFPSWWERIAVLAIAAIDLAYVACDLTDWRWSGTPDEAHFFQVAKSIAEGTSDRLLFSENGVFEYHPVLSSVYQGLFMRLLGVNLFAWRLSSAVALAGSLPCLYLLARELWNRRTAFAAAIFFGCAPLAVGFAHFGYNNVQVYPVVVGSLAVLAWAHGRRSLTGYYIAGCIAGLGFYTCQIALAAPLLVVLLGLSLCGLPLRKGGRHLTAALILGFVVMALPAWAHLDQTIAHLVRQSGVAGAAQSDSMARRVLEHWMLSIMYGFWAKTDHFQSNPLVDPLCGTLAAAGLWLSAVRVRRHAAARFLVVAYLSSAVLIGATSPYEHPPLTRLLFLSPFTAMLAAVALDQVLRTVAGTTRAGSALASLVGAVVVSISTASNVIAVRDNVTYRYHGYGDGTTTELIRTAQLFSRNCRIVYVQTDPTSMHDVDLILDEYGMRERFTYLHGVGANTKDALAQLQPPFVLFTNFREPEDLRQLEEMVQEAFPNMRWYDSNPAATWNVRYFYAPVVGELQTK